MPSPRTIPRVCKQCGKDFLAKKDQVRYGNAIYCSRHCRSQSLRRPAMERFMEKVEKTDDCWIWIGGQRNEHGYGGFYYKGKWSYAHRVAYRLFIGPIPDGMVIAHACDNPPCVNPDHLWVGTYQDNMIDRSEKGRHPGWVSKIFRGEEHGQSKLTDDDVREIRRRYAQGGTSYAKIGKDYDMGQSQIGAIVRRDAWPHVD